jgi:hypothetical protein
MSRRKDAFDCPLVVNHALAVGLFNVNSARARFLYSEPPEEEAPQEISFVGPIKPKPPVPRALRAEAKIKELESYIGLLKAEVKRLAVLEVRRHPEKRRAASPTRMWSDGTIPQICPTCNGFGVVEPKG